MFARHTNNTLAERRDENEGRFAGSAPCRSRGTHGAAQELDRITLSHNSDGCRALFACSWILDIRERGIRVNVPGYTVTSDLNALLDEQEQVGLAATIPLQRLGTADDLGKAALVPRLR